MNEASCIEPLVSITCAFYNAEKTLTDMVKSIAVQSYRNWELILLDDGSNDHSLDFAKTLKNPKIKVLSNHKNLGSAPSLNKLNGLCGGKYIARMDADDMCSPSRIEKQVELLESNPSVDLAGTGICYLDPDDEPVGYAEALQGHKDICRYPSRTFGLCHGSIMGRKEWFEKNHYDNSLKIAVDFNLWLRTYSKSIFSNVPDPLYYYRFDNSFHLRKSIAARVTSANFLFRYYMSKGNMPMAARSYGMQYTKLAFTFVAFLCGLREKMMKRRYTPIGSIQKEAINLEIAKIKDYRH